LTSSATISFSKRMLLHGVGWLVGWLVGQSVSQYINLNNPWLCGPFNFYFTHSLYHLDNMTCTQLFSKRPLCKSQMDIYATIML